MNFMSAYAVISSKCRYIGFTKTSRKIRLENKYTRLSGSFQRKISGSNGTSEKVAFERYLKRKNFGYSLVNEVQFEKAQMA